MMKKGQFPVFILVALNLILLGSLIYFHYSYTQSMNASLRIRKALSNNLMYQENIMKYQLYSDGRKLNSKLLLQKEKGEKVAFSKVVKKQVLVFRYSELNCQSCVDAMLTQLQKNKKFNNSNTLLLAWYNNPSYLYQFKRMNRLNLNVFSIKTTSLPPDTLNIPYFYLLDKDLKVSNVFIPEEGDTASVASYLIFVEKRLKL